MQSPCIKSLSAVIIHTVTIHNVNQCSHHQYSYTVQSPSMQLLSAVSILTVTHCITIHSVNQCIHHYTVTQCIHHPFSQSVHSPLYSHSVHSPSMQSLIAFTIYTVTQCIHHVQSHKCSQC